METESLGKQLWNEVTCSICQDYFTDPVILNCEHSFCRACIAGCLKKSCSRTLCPLCKQTTRSKKFKANRHLANITEITKQMNEGKQEPEGRPLCGKHKEPLKLFCKDDKAPICVVCDRSKEHRDHNVIPVEEAAQEYKDQISRMLEMLKKQREEILGYKTTTEKESQDLLKQIETEKGNTVDMLTQLSQFIKNNFQHTPMDQVKEEIEKKRNEHLSTLSQEVSSLDSIIQEMEERNQWPDTELLQDIEQTLQKCERGTFENPVVFPLTLKWKIWQFHDKNSSLASIIKKFKDAVAKSNNLQKANVTLHTFTAHPEILISKDKKSLTTAKMPQFAPISSLLCQNCAYVEGYRLFNSCTCYWDVVVRNEGAWAVGVSEQFVCIKINLRPSPKNGVWAIGRWDGLYRAVIYPEYPPLTLSKEPKKIRLCLNKKAQLLTFFDADTAALLYTFSLAGSLYDICPFFWIWEKTHIQICA